MFYYSVFFFETSHILASLHFALHGLSLRVTGAEDDLRAIFIVLGLLTMIIIASCGAAWTGWMNGRGERVWLRVEGKRPFEKCVFSWFLWFCFGVGMLY